MDFVCSVGIPDDKLSILRSRDEMTSVGRPVHSVDLGEMTLERPTGLHSDARQSVGLILRDLTDCTAIVSISGDSTQVPECRGLLFPHSMETGFHTSGIGQLILSALDPILQAFSFAPGRGDLGLHLLAAHIGCHLDGASPWKG